MMRALVLAVVALSLLSLASLSRAAEDRNTASSAVRKQVTEATADLTKAQATLAVKKAELRMDAEKTDEWAKALEAQKKAKEDMDAAAKPVLEALAAKADYQKLLADKKTAETRKETLRLNGAGPDKLYDAAMKVVTAQTAIKKLEDEALAADPKFTEAKKRYTEATAALAALQKKFDDGLKTNPEYKTALDAVAAAQEKVTTARKAATDAAKTDAEANRQRRTQDRGDSRRTTSSRDSRRTERRGQEAPQPAPVQPKPEQPAPQPGGQ
jgi:hypothetical protein